jgi:tetratricopeptide (TPR) repeat protein
MNCLLENNHNLSSEKLIDLINIFLAKIKLQPTNIYLDQQKKLQNDQEKIKLQEEAKEKQKQINKYLTNARKHASQQRYNQAIPEVRKVLQIETNNTQAHQILQEYLEADREQSLPRGQNAYSQARRADLQKRHTEAEKLYLEAIEQRDRLDNAVLDLASLYRKLGREVEEINILLKYKDIIRNKKAFNNLLADTYKKMGEYKEEIKCREQVLALTTYEKRPTVLRLIASAYFNLRQYEKATEILETVLRQSSHDENAKKQLEEAGAKVSLK